MSSNSGAAALKESGSFRAWLIKPNVQKWLVIITFAIVPVILLLLFIYYPIGKMVEFSLYNMSYTKVKGFVGLKNYIDIFAKPELFQTFRVSLYYMVGAIVQIALALYFATILSFKTKFTGVYKAAMFFPYLVNGIALGFIFKFFYTRGYVLDTVLTAFGIPLESLPYWLRDQSINNWSLVATSLWKYMGQNMVLFSGAIMSVDPTLYEAASIDGANKWHQFRYIILPSISTVLTLNVILSITGSLSAFEPPYVITSMGGNGTATYFIKMHETAHTLHKVGLASAMAVVLITIIILCTIIQKLVFKYAFRNSGTDSAKTKMKRKQFSKGVN
ncbi:MAG: sugar ABC transporter permease [Eubacteriales bacterium]|nr:sugar ABC transporter permease [Eubacteriales bacterium]MDD3881196.1 sugar ABC transporter permease [Eubacteriales bacterium]MDD4511578.1 sugar ABC transporter permease [Eubacteriales bacterium]